jgi:hypothetical protein
MPLSGGFTACTLTWFCNAAAIAFKKKSFRPYFEQEENYLFFHQMIPRIMDANHGQCRQSRAMGD